MRERIFCHPITSISGFVVLLASIIAFFLGKISWEQGLAGLTIASGLFASKDPQGPPPIAMFLIGFLFLQSCITYDSCARKYGHLANEGAKIDTTLNLDVPVKVDVPPETLTGSIDLDSAKNLKATDTITDTVYIEDPSSKIKIKYWKDLYHNSINFRADYKSPPIEDTVKHKVNISLPCPPSVIFQSSPKKAPLQTPGRWQRFWAGYKTFSVWICSILIFLILLEITLSIIKKFKI